METLSLQGIFYVGFSCFYVWTIYHGLKALFEIRDLLKPQAPVQKKTTKKAVKK